jgi:hypothetical protein
MSHRHELRGKTRGIYGYGASRIGAERFFQTALEQLKVTGYEALFDPVIGANSYMPPSAMSARKR